MSTTMINSSTARIPCQPLGHYDAAVEQRVQQWLASGQLLAWIPILSQENFPDVPPQILQFADQHQEAMRWPIYRPEDLLALPDGITGWLVPADADDTDVTTDRMTEEELLKGLEGLTPPESVPEPDTGDDEE